MNSLLSLHLTACVALAAAGAGAQAPAPPARTDTAAVRREVLALVNRMFVGMRTRDTASIRSTLHPAAALISAVTQPNGAPAIQVDTIDSWLRSIATPRPEVLDERIFNEKVLVDGTLATVWVEYSFYLGAKLNHCGVDAFQIAKGPSGWQIIALADTRRRTGCTEVPAASSPPALAGVVETEFALAPGQTASFAALGLTVRFDRVSNDSRCPRGATCVWAGNAAVLVTLQRAGAAAYAVTLNSYSNPKSAKDGNETVTLVGLLGQPDVNRPIVSSEYRARLVVRSGP
jgi:hypothetical protein